MYNKYLYEWTGCNTVHSLPTRQPKFAVYIPPQVSAIELLPIHLNVILFLK